MTDYPKALAAARECLDNEGHRATDALRDLLAALDAVRGEAVADGEKLWLWRHRDHFLAFKHEYPCFTPGGDPMTLGPPSGYALFQVSHDRGCAAPPAALAVPPTSGPDGGFGWFGKAPPAAAVAPTTGAHFAGLDYTGRPIYRHAEPAQPPAALAVPAGYVPVSALIEARDHVEDWAAYSSPYFQEKHDLAGVLAEIDAQIAAAQAQQPAAAVPEGGLRDSVLNSAKFRASCYALVGIAEGIQGLGRCWAANGERLKDTPEWVAFYNCVAAMRNGTFNQASAEQAQPAAAVPAANVTPMRQPRADLARLVESINAAVYANGDGLSVTEAIGALELAKLELLKEQEQ